MSLSKIPSRPDFVDLVYTNLRDAISDGTLSPGERVTQEDLAARLNVSRSPVLQALRMLRKDGLLEEAPGRGLIVTRLDPERVRHLYQVRGAFDALAARLSAERGKKVSLVLVERGKQAVQTNDVNAMIEADMVFHQSIYEASGNPLIADHALLHWVHVRRLMGAVLRHSVSRQGIWEEHEAIAKAINDGDGLSAALLSEQHVDAACQALIVHMERAHLSAA